MSSPELTERIGGTELTTRELRVLELMSEGHSNKAIGNLMGISELTVKNHIQKVLARLESTGRIHAVYRGYEEGLLTPPQVNKTLCHGSNKRHHIATPVVAPAKEQHIRDVVTIDAKDWLRYDRILISESHRILRVDGKDVDIYETEFDLLMAFMRKTGHIFTRRVLLDSVWGKYQFIEERTVDVHIRRLRIVLEVYGIDIIETVRGAGYRLKPLVQSAPPTI